MIKIEFGEHNFSALRKHCPMCGAVESSPLLRVGASSFDPQELCMNSCRKCGTAYFVNEQPVLGYNYEGFEQNFWFNYVQNGAGISAMLEPLFSLQKEKSGSLLDIGCGFGFVPHFWKEMIGGEAIGLEMSSYGRVGAEKLGVNIVPKYYSEAHELHGKKFDYVYSSEVIEHVENPEAFINEISQALEDDGVLVLTTPSASVLRPSSDYLLLLATLSPGFHFFVSSEDAMRDLLLRCGFEHVVVHDAGHRLFVWASRVELPAIKEGFSDWSIYLNYLERLSANADHHVASGALYRAIKDCYNLGHFDRASENYQKFKLLVREKFEIDFDSIEDTVLRLRARKDLDNEKFPSWIGCSLLYAGLIEGLNGSSLEKQLKLISASIEAMQKEIELAAQFAGEPAYFIRMAIKSHAELCEKAAAAGLIGADSSQAIILRYPGDLKSRDVCVFAAYSSQMRLNDAIVDYVDNLVANGVEVIISVAVDDPTMPFDLSNLSSASGILIRGNGGFDFATWSTGLRLFPEIWGARRIFLANDSMFMLPSLLPDFLGKIRVQDADFVGVTESFQKAHHAQSYFVMFQGNALREPGLQSYLSNLPVLSSKEEVIQAFELTLLSRVRFDFGLSHKVMYPLEELFPGARQEEYGNLNITHTYWDYLVGRGFPFVKVELLRDNPIKSNILQWRFVFEKFGCSIDKAVQHMSTPRAGRLTVLAGERAGKEQPKKSKRRNEFQIILSELNRVRLNARRRRRERRHES
ncbi:MAG: methyltransferase domain-containing protein [Paracoccaceae bacterium]|nr:methyltransferase domain-containing protein [Paracoccaceae bacterium]